MPTTLSIVIVSWNVCDLLRACLQSIYANQYNLLLEVIVVDNSSADSTIAMISAEFPTVKLLAQTSNMGFPQGNNIGIAAATGDYIFLLNPDTEIHSTALQRLVEHLQTHPNVGLVGPQLFNTDGSHQSSRRRFPSFLTGLFESTWYEPFAPSGLLSRYYVQDSDDNKTAHVDWVSGAAMLTRRSVVEQVGGMDPDYFMYSEELDWCHRIKALGWQIVYLPAAHITHHVGKSSEQAVTQRHINFNRAKLRYFRKYHGKTAYRSLRIALLAGFYWQMMIEAGKALLGHKRELRKQRVRAYREVIQSGLTAAGFSRDNS